MKTLKLKPASKDVTVRDPRTGAALKPGGEDKPATTYWRRRLRDGDVIDLNAKPEPKATGAAAKTDGGKS